jgi:hypothetical protein
MFSFNIIEKLKLVFNFGRKNKRTVGILNQGKHNTFENNKFYGYDEGIRDQGEDTKAKDNKFYK